MKRSFKSFVDSALAEDIGEGDITSELTVAARLEAKGTFFARQDCVIAGTFLLPEMYDRLEILAPDGTAVAKDTPIAKVEGRARHLLSRERTALNFLQRLSGIATLTRKYVDQLTGTKCQLLDTRKTTPGLRVLEKMATKAGGALNHRMGLHDAVLIKNNHISAAGGVGPALQAAMGKHPRVEIEVAKLVDGRFQLFGGNGLWRGRLLHALGIGDGRRTHQNEETEDQQRVSAP